MVVGCVLAKSSKLHLPFKNKKAALCAAFFILRKPLVLVVILTGCHGTLKDQLKNLAENSVLNQSVLLTTDSYTLLGWGKNKNTPHVNVYIEGDGQSWQDPWTISLDPTPPDPVGFKLALADSRSDSVLYLARPCQYIMSKGCSTRDWTSDRFAQKVIHTYNQALNQIKETWSAKTFTLHGYSGGATVSLLVATSRTDVTSVVTFAPLLDPHQWTKYHDYSSLSGSLSPLNQSARLKQIPQEHFIGLEDQQVPQSVSTKYFIAVPESSKNKVYRISSFTHHSDWPSLWGSYIVKTKQTLSP
jgi:hypothetical protein